LIFASTMGPVAVAWMLAAVTTIGTIANIAFVCRVSGVAPSSILEAFRPSVGAAAVLAVGVAIALRSTASLPPALQLMVAGVAGIVVYAAAVRVISPATWRELRQIVTERRELRGGAATVLARAEARR
jgi:hypothetical protein